MAQKGTLTSLVTERDRDSERIQALRAQLDVAIEKAATESARADHLRAELDRLRLAQEARPNKGLTDGTRIRRRRVVKSAG